MSWPDNVYDQPEKYGLIILAEIGDEAASYDFDDVVVWREDATGKLYWANDSGCSCPSPFENYGSVEDLTELRDVRELQRHFDSEPDYVKRDAAAKQEMYRKVRDALREKVR